MGIFLRVVTSGVLLLPAAALAQAPSPIAVPNLSSATYTGPIFPVAAPPLSHNVTGRVQLAIKLQDPPLVVAVGTNAKQNGIAMSATQQRAYLAQLKQRQDAVMSQVTSLGGVELGRVAKGHNALMVSIDARQIQALHGIPGVVAVRPITDYHLSDTAQPTIPVTAAFLGAVSVQTAGFRGQGIRIAMLDTGIDYTHYNLGGSGKVSDYQAALAVARGTPPSNLFPTAKVVGGYDFTGETWPNGPLQPDANPIDINGHGSHTADIAGGHSVDNVHFGMAPGSQLYAVKVCSSISPSCSGVAILEGIDFALDPTNSGTVNNAVDIISMSIGGPFGQREDDESEAFADVVNFGVVSVVAGGNEGDIPYILGQPASAPEVIAAGATSSVLASGIPLVVNAPPTIRGTYPNTATLDFAPIDSAVTGAVAHVGRGCPAGSISAGSPADTYLANPNGKVALIDRGACAISLKIDAAARAGARAVLIGLVAPGDAIPFSNGGGSDFVPSLVITQATANTIKTALTSSAVNVTVSPANAIPLVSNVASYSSRGPNFSYNMLKPDLSAPGMVSAAQPGTGNGETTESGTSFSCPLTAGAAALMLSKNHSLTPLDVKAMLMETSDPVVYQNGLTMPGALAPMSRMGAGELRVDRAASSTTAVWDASGPLGVSLSYGTYRLNTNQSFRKKIVVRNYSSTARTYTISNTYRDAPNVTGFTLSFPSSVFVPANGAASFNLLAIANASALPTWTLNGGSSGSNGELLNTVEYAGYLTFSGGGDTVHLPWHILPHKAANVTVSSGGSPGTLVLNNTTGAVGGLVDIFSLTGTGTPYPPSVLPAPGSDYAVINLQAVGIRPICIANCATASPSYGVQFAINTFGQRSHPDVPAEFDVRIDVNHDGTDDLVVFNDDIGSITTGTFSGQNGVFVADLGANIAYGPYFYTVADLDSANAILTVPLSALRTASGLSLGISTPFTFSVLAFDNYFTGNLTDEIGPMRYELDNPKFFASAPQLVVPNGGTSPLTLFATAGYNGNSPSQTGLLFMYTDGKTGQEAATVSIAGP